MTDQITADQVIEHVDKYKQWSIGSNKAGKVLSKRHVQCAGRGKMRAVQLGLAVAVAVIIEMMVSVLAPVGTASATPPQPVRIENQVDFSDPVTEFFAIGGIVCESGTAESTPFAHEFVFAGKSGRHEQIVVGKHMTCDDGTFDLLLRVRLDLETFDTEGTWSVVTGTGAYEGLHGGGEIVGTRLDNGGFNAPILDVYTGDLHVN